MNKTDNTKKSNILFIGLPVLIIILIALIIVNYFILPPKTSDNAAKYKYYGYNFLQLKSITDDEDKVIIEFGSLNFNFNYFFNRNKIESSGNDFKFIRWIGNLDPYYNINSYPDYYIISTLTSNYLVISKTPEMKTEDLYSFKYYIQYQDTTVSLSFFEKYENAKIYMSKEYYRKNNEIEKTRYKSQSYNSYDKEWNSLEKSTIYNGVTITTEE
ncbi:MAG: hypothetical protein IKX08_08815 [Lachnospiraceae bacterium]|nr:hypothetical protein [Lachnospiraceae bacterium]